MDNSVFKEFCALIHKESGIYLPPEKEQLLANRIQKRLRSLGLKNEEKYLEIIELDISGQELTLLLDAISTNVTYFYREERHFQILEELLKKHKASSAQEVKIWCAASSSGEEPYTLSMVASEVGCKTRILATDISTRVLNKALGRCYEEKQLEKLPMAYRAKYFRKVIKDEEPYFEVTKDVADRVIFKRLNLAKFPIPLNGGIDMIFCRNVMIYFKKDLRAKLVEEFLRLLKPGGYLFLSHSENLLGIDHPFKTTATAVYQKPEGR